MKFCYTQWKKYNPFKYETFTRDSIIAIVLFINSEYCCDSCETLKKSIYTRFMTKEVTNGQKER